MIKRLIKRSSNDLDRTIIKRSIKRSSNDPSNDRSNNHQTIDQRAALVMWGSLYPTTKKHCQTVRNIIGNRFGLKSGTEERREKHTELQRIKNVESPDSRRILKQNKMHMLCKCTRGLPAVGSTQE